VDLDLVVGVVARPALPRAGRAGVLALLLSHGAALVRTGLGDGLPPLTLQPAARPWETWLVLPTAWALAARAARHLASQDPVSGVTTTGSLATVTVRDRPWGWPHGPLSVDRAVCAPIPGAGGGQALPPPDGRARQGTSPNRGIAPTVPWPL